MTMFDLMLDPWIFITLIIWSVLVKAVSLWRSARRGDKVWFFILLLVNTLGILDMIYITFFGREQGERLSRVIGDVFRSTPSE